MKRLECDRGWQEDALREGRLGPDDAESFERHRRSCGSCDSAVVRDERLRALGRALPAIEVTPLELRRLRARVLRDVSTGEPRPFPWRGLAAASSMVAMLAGLGTVVAARGGSPGVTSAISGATVAASPVTLAGSVVASAGAAWKQTREDGVERVELEEGTLRVHVRPQSAAERFFDPASRRRDRSPRNDLRGDGPRRKDPRRRRRRRNRRLEASRGSRAAPRTRGDLGLGRDPAGDRDGRARTELARTACGTRRGGPRAERRVGAAAHGRCAR